MLLALTNYSVDGVKQLLKKLNFEKYWHLVDENRVTGKLLNAAKNQDHLKKMDIVNRLDAQKLLKRIKEIKRIIISVALMLFQII